jgi:hypothetical protein
LLQIINNSGREVQHSGGCLQQHLETHSQEIRR